jgi:hypothetical protein
VSNGTGDVIFGLAVLGALYWILRPSTATSGAPVSSGATVTLPGFTGPVTVPAPTTPVQETTGSVGAVSLSPPTSSSVGESILTSSDLPDTSGFDVILGHFTDPVSGSLLGGLNASGSLNPAVADPNPDQVGLNASGQGVNAAGQVVTPNRIGGWVDVFQPAVIGSGPITQDQALQIPATGDTP